MKTIRIVVMIIMAITTVFFIVFAQIQRDYAEAALIESEEHRKKTEEYAKRLEEQETRAIKMAAMARQAEIEAENMVKVLEADLRKCRNN